MTTTGWGLLLVFVAEIAGFILCGEYGILTGIIAVIACAVISARCARKGRETLKLAQASTPWLNRLPLLCAVLLHGALRFIIGAIACFYLVLFALSTFGGPPH